MNRKRVRFPGGSVSAFRWPVRWCEIQRCSLWTSRCRTSTRSCAPPCARDQEAGHQLGITTVYVTHDQVEAMSMADRIAVMNKAPWCRWRLSYHNYDRPATAFVADFIGSPAMNLFEAELSHGGVVVCSVQGFADALTADERQRAGALADAQGHFLIGVRPEHVRIVAAGTKGSTSANVEFVEPLGQTTNVYVEVGNQKFVVVTDRTTARIGDAIGLETESGKVRAVAKSA